MTLRLSNDQAIALTGTTGDISFTSTAGLIDARDRTVNLETVNGKINFSNGGVISSTQEINDADATATDNYAVRCTEAAQLMMKARLPIVARLAQRAITVAD